MNTLMRKQPVGPYSPHNFQLEPGDRVFLCVNEDYSHIYDLYESTGRNKRDAGELSARLVKKANSPRRATRDEQGMWHWKD